MSPTPIGFYIESGSSMTGGPRFAYNLMRALDRERFRPVAVTNEEGELARWLRDAGVTVHIIPQTGRIGSGDGKTLAGGRLGQLLAFWDMYRYNRRVARVMKAESARLLWARNVKGVLLTAFAARRLRLPLVWDIGMEKPSRGMMRRLHNFAFRRASNVVVQGSFVAPSIFDAAQLAAYGDKIVVNLSALAPDRVEGVRRDTMTPPDPGGRFRILSVATLNDRKNQMMLLRAVHQLKDRFPRLQVHLVGPATDEGYERRLRDYVRDHGLDGHVEFLGWRSDVPGLLHAAHLFALTSRVEGIPQVVLEAMYARVPIIATAAGGVPDVVEDGVTGRLISIDDDTAFTDALADCLAHPEKLVGFAEAAYLKACSTITTRQWYKRYEAIFDTLLESTGEDRHG